MHSSIRSSVASGSFSPRPSKNLMPLSGAGLCDALITAPATKPSVRARYASPGVGTWPTSRTSMPTEQSPAASALSSMRPERRVSRPMTTL